jgi:hypothetical protein
LHRWLCAALSPGCLVGKLNDQWSNSNIRTPTAGGTFAPPDAGPVPETRPTAAPKAAGNLDAATVSRLGDAAANLKSSSGDPDLDAVLSEIELRVEVELAKAGQF